jgi:hypothetical protein
LVANTSFVLHVVGVQLLLVEPPHTNARQRTESGTLTMNKTTTKTTLALLAALTLAAGSAQAARVTISGHVNHAGTGSVGPLAAGAISNTNFSASGQNTSVSGVLRAKSFTDVDGRFMMSLAWDDVNVVTCHPTAINFTVNITQDFAVPAGFNKADFNSFTARTDFIAQGNNQSATITRTRSDNGVMLPVAVSNAMYYRPVGTYLIDDDAAFANTANASTIAGIYRVNMAIAFTLSSCGDILRIQDCDGIEDVTGLVMVPLPTAAWAGMGGLAMVGLARVRRNRMHNQA